MSKQPSTPHSEDEPVEVRTLADAYFSELARCRELLTQYKAIGPAGMFGYAVINNVLQRAHAAVMCGDTVAMLGLYEEMKGCQ